MFGDEKAQQYIDDIKKVQVSIFDILCLQIMLLQNYKYYFELISKFYSKYKKKNKACQKRKNSGGKEH